jgi:putative ABC transport system ATP-binding protein
VKLVELRNVWKIYKTGKRIHVEALRGINLQIKKGDFLTIMGPSGSGKSTLMHIIGCLDKPTRGEVFIKGYETSKLSDEELAKIRNKMIGFVFQSFNLIPTLTALENVMLPMMFAKVPRNKREKRARELLEKLGLSDLGDHFPNQLSGGEQQRVAIARALANNPELILADEPTGNLDSKASRNIMRIFRKLNREGKTLVVVTHDPTWKKYSKKTINIIDGKIKGR